jgi:hypothetical protein
MPLKYTLRVILFPDERNSLICSFNVLEARLNEN